MRTIKLLADTTIPLAPTGIGCDPTGASFGPFSCIVADAGKLIGSIATIISNLVGFLTIIAGLWFGFQLIMGGFGWITSGGDKQGLEHARNRMIHAFLGLIVVVAALAIIAVIGTVAQLDILLTNPTKIGCLLNSSITDKSTCR